MNSEQSGEADFIKTTKTLALAMQDGTLIDFETTGIPGKTQTFEVVTLGYLNENRAVVLQRKCKEKKPFYEEIIKILSDLPKPFYAYNASFERDIMKLELGMGVADNDFMDLMYGWRAKADEAETKWPSVTDLMSEPEDYFAEAKVTGKQVPFIWNLYASSEMADGLLTLIAEHLLERHTSRSSPVVEISRTR